MQSVIGIALLVVGVVLIIFGMQASASLGSRLSEHFTGARMVEYIGCLYPIEVAQVGCILGRTITARPPT